MSFHNYTLKQLKQILNDFKKHHNIRNYHKLKKSDLIHELDKRFEIDCGYLYLKGGTAKNAGYVRRMEAENKIIFDKIQNPSKYMIDKYGNKHAEPEHYPEPEYHYEAVHHEPAPHDAHDLPLFTEHETLDFNVGKDKPKKPKKKSKLHIPTEAEEERQEQERLKELERKKKLLNELELLKKQIVECKNKLGKENNNYHKLLEELKHRRGITKLKKADRQEEIIVEHLSNIKKIKGEYPQVFQYIKQHKLKQDDLNEMYKHVGQIMKKVFLTI
jgi:hypothetical protein